MKQIQIGKNGPKGPALVVGCMRLRDLEEAQTTVLVEKALELGCNWFDHADIYGDGVCHTAFAKAVTELGVPRERYVLQSKCGIRRGVGYDSSKEHIIASVERILRELHTDYLDQLLLHRPDALLEPEEVAEAFDRLEASGKVRAFGVSNYRTSTLRFLKSTVRQPLRVNQLQFSLGHCGMIRSQLEANVESGGAADLDGGILDHCRMENVTIQAWSPFQYGMFEGTFLDSPEFPALNRALEEIAADHGLTKTAVAAAWIFRHPAGMRLVSGTTKPDRLAEIAAGAELQLSRREWYRLYQAAGNQLP